MGEIYSFKYSTSCR